MRTNLSLPGAPRAFARTSSDPATGRRRTPAIYREWKERAAARINLTRAGNVHTDEVIAYVAVYTDGISLTFTDAAPGRSRPRGVTGDLDNYVKAALDAAQDGHVLPDDKSVVKIEAWFAAGPMPAVSCNCYAPASCVHAQRSMG